MRLALLNHFQNKTRLVISVGGVALALLLIISLDAIFSGVEKQITAYINHSGADVIVSQHNVRNMHMASSSLPASIIDTAEEIPGIAAITPILYLANMVVVGDERNLAYIIGLPDEVRMGGPWDLAMGSGELRPGEAIIDRTVAEKSGVDLGDEVEILGTKFKLTGLADGTASLVNSIAFISISDFEKLRGSTGTVSFLLVKIYPGESPEEISARIEARVTGATATPVNEFAAQEKRVVKDMSTDVITIMNMVGFLIGLAVMALTVYTATLARKKEYGVLKALGAQNGDLYRTVFTQAFMSVILGFAVSTTITMLLSRLITLFGLNLVLEVSTMSLVKVGIVSIVIAGFSALLPIRQISGLDPANVFRGK